jgi:hypothetical protein
MGAMLITPLYSMLPEAHASYNCSYFSLSSSSLFHLILPLKSPSRILLTLSCSHFEGMKLRLLGGWALKGMGSLYSSS